MKTMLLKKIFQSSVALLFFFFVVHSSAQQAPSQENSSTIETKSLQVLAGESAVVTQDFAITRVSVGSPDVLTASQTSSSEILVNGVGPGNTNLILWGEGEQRVEYSVTVLDQRGLSEIAAELTRLFSEIDGITIKTVGAKNIIEGTVYSSEELNRINKVLESYPGVINLAETGEIYNKLLADEIKKTIGIDGVNVRYTKSGYILDGIVISEFEAQYAHQIAKSFTDNVINALYINPNLQAEQSTGQVVQLDLKIIEVSKDKFSDKINDFTVGFDGVGTAADDESDLSGTVTIADPNLRKLTEDSNGRVLIEQSVVVESRKTANLFVGDEVPIPIQQGNAGITIEYRDVGFGIDVTPLAYSDNTVDLDVSITSSNVTGQAINGGPELSTVRIKSTARVASELNVVFAGLISQRDLRDFVGNAGDHNEDKNPNRFADDRREVLVMIKPRILKSLNSTMPQMKRAVERSFKDYEIRRKLED